jgi:hypothetical protein
MCTIKDSYVLNFGTIWGRVVTAFHTLGNEFRYPVDRRYESGWLSGIALGYGLHDRGFESRQGLGIYLFTTASRPALGPTQPPVQWVTGALSLEIKRPERETDHSPPPSAEVKNARSYTSTLPVRLKAWCSVTKHRENSTFTFTFTLTCGQKIGWAPEKTQSPLPLLLQYGKQSGALMNRGRNLVCLGAALLAPPSPICSDISLYRMMLFCTQISCSAEFTNMFTHRSCSHILTHNKSAGH